MQDKLVLVVCNLKASKIVGFNSTGLVLCAKNGDTVELVEPPAGSVVGERVCIEGFSGEPQSATQVKKKKCWDILAKELKTNDNGEASWKGGVMKTSAGACAAKCLKDSPIS